MPENDIPKYDVQKRLAQLEERMDRLENAHGGAELIRDAGRMMQAEKDETITWVCGVCNTVLRSRRGLDVTEITCPRCKAAGHWRREKHDGGTEVSARRQAPIWECASCQHRRTSPGGGDSALVCCPVCGSEKWLLVPNDTAGREGEEEGGHLLDAAANALSGFPGHEALVYRLRAGAKSRRYFQPPRA